MNVYRNPIVVSFVYNCIIGIVIARIMKLVRQAAAASTVIRTYRQKE